MYIVTQYNNVHIDLKDCEGLCMSNNNRCKFTQIDIRIDIVCLRMQSVSCTLPRR